jgi:hypothetical protein
MTLLDLITGKFRQFSIKSYSKLDKGGYYGSNYKKKLLVKRINAVQKKIQFSGTVLVETKSAVFADASFGYAKRAEQLPRLGQVTGFHLDATHLQSLQFVCS